MVDFERSVFSMVGAVREKEARERRQIVKKVCERMLEILTIVKLIYGEEGRGFPESVRCLIENNCRSGVMII